MLAGLGIVKTRIVEYIIVENKIIINYKYKKLSIYFVFLPSKNPVGLFEGSPQFYKTIIFTVLDT